MRQGGYSFGEILFVIMFVLFATLLFLAIIHTATSEDYIYERNVKKVLLNGTVVNVSVNDLTISCNGFPSFFDNKKCKEITETKRRRNKTSL